MPTDPTSHFLQLSDHSPQQLSRLLDVAETLKHQLKSTGKNAPILAGKTLAMLFEKPSLRTRVSFATAMTQLGGSALELRQEEVGLDVREPAADVARVLSGMVNAIMIRTFGQDRVEKLAHTGSIPVINGLTDLCHPCQAMADVLTLKEHFGSLTGLHVVFVGDGNNVARSLAVACAKFGMTFTLAAPAGYELPQSDLDRIHAQVPGFKINQTRDPLQALDNGGKGTHCIYTDTWVSMGQEAEKKKRIAEFTGFTVDAKLLAAAGKHAVVLHCLPAYRGLEISDDVMESSRSLVFPQAHNRLHAQKAILAVLLGAI